jgi:type II secretory pathway pseudopilin PulG
MEQPMKTRKPIRRKSQAGTSLLETLIALAILMIVAVGLLPLAVVAVSTTENQGHLGARTAEYAQDKMEQLLTLSYNDNVTDVTVFPSGVCGGTCGLWTGGSTDPKNPVAGYADYLDANGNVLATGAANWYYIRVWKVEYVTTSPLDANAVFTMKKITVVSQVAHQIGSAGLVPQATVTAIKTEPF